MATEGFVNALARVIKKDFGLTKIFVDWGCVALTVIISFIALGHLDGVREGTVINAFLNGYFVRVFTKHIRFLDSFVGTRQDVLPEAAYGTASYPLVITIDREMGSGGGLIAEALSKALGIKLYDYELIEKTAKEAGLPAEDVMKRDERLGSYILKNRPNTMKLFFSADPECLPEPYPRKFISHIRMP